MKTVASIVVLAASAFACRSAHATTFGFAAITTNSIVDPAIGASQLFVDVTPISASSILFTFRNVGSQACSITDVYFQAPGLISSISLGGMSSGVSFGLGASPSNLPAGNSLSPNFVATHSADSNAPTQPSGVNPGEWIEFIAQLPSGLSFTSTIASITSEQLRLGIHVQGFADGQSESFVNTVPGPGALALAASGAVLCRRRKRSN